MPLDRDIRRAGIESMTRSPEPEPPKLPEVMLPRGMRIAAAVAAAIALGTTVVAFTAPSILP